MNPASKPIINLTKTLVMPLPDPRRFPATVPKIPPGRYRVGLVDDMDSAGEVAGATDAQLVDVFPGETSPLTLDLSGHGSLRPVVRAGAERYAGNLNLELWHEDWRRPMLLKWERGSHLISPLQPGKYRLGYGPGFRGISDPEDAHRVWVMVTAGEELEVPMTLPPWRQD